MAVRPHILVCIIVCALLAYGKLYVREWMREVHLIQKLFPWFPWQRWAEEKSPIPSKRSNTSTKTTTTGKAQEGGGSSGSTGRLEQQLDQQKSGAPQEEKKDKKMPHIRKLSPYDKTKPTLFQSEWEKHQCRMFTELELCTERARPIYLAIAGEVFDVSKGEGYYGDNGGYWYLARGDCSLGFTDLSRTESFIPDWTPSQVSGIDDWRKSYHEQYTFVGLLLGDYYGPHGVPTNVTADFLDKLEEQKRIQARLKAHRQRFPGCNSRSDSKGMEVWCSVKSGGIAREWVGVPRLIRRPGSKDRSCACIHDFTLLTDDEAMESYVGCPDDADRCKMKRG